MARASIGSTGLGGWLLAAALHCGLLSGGLLPAIAVAGQWQYTKIVDRNTLAPDGSPFGSFFPEPGWDGERVIFSNGSLYSYSSNLGFSALVGNSTPIPGGIGTFHGVGPLSADQGAIIFAGGDSSSGLDEQGFYRLSNGVIERLVDRSMAIPDGTGLFSQFRGVTSSAFGTDAGRIVFAGRGENDQRGVYLFDNGSLTRLVDTSTTIPGGVGSFIAFDSPVIHGNQVLFSGYGADDQRGIYLVDPTGVTLVADRNTLAPDYPLHSTFDSFTQLGWAGDTPTFVGNAATFGRGPNVYQLQNGVLSPQIDPVGSLPGLVVPGLFHSIYGLATDETGFAVTGVANDWDSGIWLSRNGVLEKVIGPGDVLEGVTIFGADDEVGDPSRRACPAGS